ncbi:MAG: T9SS type A sorting domain-containing protein [Bacteroidetes bacterium]|nr:T9SS type A sorting domain-containing protein [Bacteroidota bacterium]
MNPVCDGTSPEVLIKNYGTAPLTSLTFHYGIDGSTSFSYIWTGSLNFLDTASVILPLINFGAGNHSFTVYTDNPNSSTDEFVHDDTLLCDFSASNILNLNGIWIQLKNDGSPNEASWDIKDVSGTVLFSRSGFTTAYGLYNDTIYLPNGCYSVSVYDSYGDGLCCYGGGQGFFSINQIDGNVLYTVRDFGAAYTKNITLDYTTGINEKEEKGTFFVYPNPASQNIRINTSFESGNTKVELVDISGRIVLEEENLIISNHLLELNIEGIQSGVYFISLTTDGKRISKKLMVN